MPQYVPFARRTPNPAPSAAARPLRTAGYATSASRPRRRGERERTYCANMPSELAVRGWDSTMRTGCHEEQQGTGTRLQAVETTRDTPPPQARLHLLGNRKACRTQPTTHPPDTPGTGRQGVQGHRTATNEDVRILRRAVRVGRTHQTGLPTLHGESLYPVRRTMHQRSQNVPQVLHEAAQEGDSNSGTI